ncbi:alpha/beta hydrolase [Demequina sp. NBRC 110051]|uniref:alpha/beta hydrolase n=1 Tax=Demequina sp. NBRC 110051 TaxID=1570340 RepID=UPI0009FEEA80|nr:alpha/beta hydrolase [Demequina sp. NBRC 110051]
MTGSDTTPATGATWAIWTGRLVAVAAVLAPAWVFLTAWSPVTHGSPAYAVLLLGTAVLGTVALWRSWRRPPRSRGWRVAVRFAGHVLAAAWVAFLVWLTPFGATEPSLSAMDGSAEAIVTESPSQILIEPSGNDSTAVGVLFQPGARVDARAYVAELLPLAEAGYPVIIIKQPLGIAFTALSRWPDPLREPYATEWVVAGHSLGGTVAAMQADDRDDEDAAGLMLLGSYPAGDISESLTVPVLSISASEDGLSTPAKIEASRADLPTDATFTVIDGASHASFGDYGVQPGDGTPTLDDDEARTQISEAMLDFLAALP